LGESWWSRWWWGALVAVVAVSWWSRWSRWLSMSDVVVLALAEGTQGLAPTSVAASCDIQIS
jgi:hypothetical protein